MISWRSYSRRFTFRELVLRSVSFLLLANWLLLALGIPLPIPLSRAKDRSNPFPCMNSPCGCQTAEKCWRECCCFTNQEKLVWAKQNGIVPPTYVVTAANRENASNCCKSSNKTTKTTCCQQKSSKEQCSIDAESKTDSSCCPEPTNNILDTEEPATQFIVLSSWHRCHGSSFHWLADVPALPPAFTKYSIFVAPGEWLNLQNQLPIEGNLSPPVPPPKAFV